MIKTHRPIVQMDVAGLRQSPVQYLSARCNWLTTTRHAYLANTECSVRVSGKTYPIPIVLGIWSIHTKSALRSVWTRTGCGLCQATRTAGDVDRLSKHTRVSAIVVGAINLSPVVLLAAATVTSRPA